MATYIIEGGSSKNFMHTKKMAFSNPEILHALLDKLTESLADYVRYQADNGAQVVQIFDSWASHLSPQDFDVFAAPYIKRIIDSVRTTHPDLPIILYISGGGGLLERMKACGPDIISFDGSVDMKDGIARVGRDVAIQVIVLGGRGWDVVECLCGVAWGTGCGVLCADECSIKCILYMPMCVCVYMASYVYMRSYTTITGQHGPRVPLRLQGLYRAAHH